MESAVDIGPDGTVVAVWRRWDGTVNRIETRSRPPGGAWSTPEWISTANVNAYLPDVKVSAFGTLAAVWMQAPTVLDAGFAARLKVAGAWQPQYDDLQRLSAAFYPEKPELAVDPFGVFSSAAELPDGRLYLYKNSGSTWTSKSFVYADLTKPPQVAVAANGDRVAATMYAGEVIVRAELNATQQTATSKSAVGSVDLAVAGSDMYLLAECADGIRVWRVGVVPPMTSLQEVLFVPGASQPTFATGAAGSLTVVYVRGAYLQSQTYAAGSWSAPLTLSTQGAGRGPVGTSDAVGHVAVVWGSADPSARTVVGTVLDSDDPGVSNASIPATGTVGQTLSFSGGTDSDFSPIASRSWTFGDGGAASGALVTHTYAAAGTYPVTYTVTDVAGNFTKISRSITITAAVVPPSTPPTTTPPTTPPSTAVTVSAVTLKPGTIHLSPLNGAVQTTLAITVNAPGKVTITFTKKGTKKPAAKITKTLKAGKNKLKIAARIGKKILKPGTYTVKVKTSTGSTKKAKLKVVK